MYNNVDVSQHSVEQKKLGISVPTVLFHFYKINKANQSIVLGLRIVVPHS